jgi:hypothetical protein
MCREELEDPTNMPRVCKLICIVSSVRGALACQPDGDSGRNSAAKDTTPPKDNPPSLVGAWETDCFKADDAYRILHIEVQKQNLKLVKDDFSDEDCIRQKSHFIISQEFELLGTDDDVKDTLKINLSTKSANVTPMTDEETASLQKLLSSSGEATCNSITLAKGVTSDTTNCVRGTKSYSIVRISDDEIQFGDCSASKACTRMSSARRDLTLI